MYAKEEKIHPACVSKHKSNREKQVILLMISNGEKKWHCLAVKKLSALLRGVTLNIMLIFIIWIYFILSQQKADFNRIKECVKIKIFVTL